MISIIIPTYGKPTYLSHSIESVINQTYNEWELIIVDDNNPDTDARKATEAIVRRYASKDSRIKYIKHPHNKNGAAARNTGISCSKGEIISFLDSDDEYMPDRLQKCLSALTGSNGSIAGVFTGCEFRHKDKTYLKYTDVHSGNHLISTLAGNFMFCTGSNIFVRKAVLDELNGFDESFIRHQDYEFLVRLFKQYSLLAIPEMLVIKNNENVNVPSIDKIIAIKTQYLDKYKDIISGLSTDEQNYIMRTHCISVAELALRQGKSTIASEYYRKAKQFGKLTLRESLRRVALKFYRLLSR